jgi:hypothetical protein
MAWLDGEADSLRRRAVHHAIRQEMELHPVERNECVGVVRPFDMEEARDLAHDRRHYWREP